VADDEPSIRQSMKMLLEHDGHVVFAVASGEAALAQLAQPKLFLVITDFSMPGMQGDELVARIRACQPDQTIILASASPGSERMGWLRAISPRAGRWTLSGSVGRSGQLPMLDWSNVIWLSRERKPGDGQAHLLGTTYSKPSPGKIQLTDGGKYNRNISREQSEKTASWCKGVPRHDLGVVLVVGRGRPRPQPYADNQPRTAIISGLAIWDLLRAGRERSDHNLTTRPGPCEYFRYANGLLAMSPRRREFADLQKQGRVLVSHH